ncbi:MAG: rhodanese-like domain-containing protein [Candidatus Sericytochromatia bacterium]|nr:rhodanese-like domain-containing protein [Candidatus Sericytochromatia bacterium]
MSRAKIQEVNMDIQALSIEKVYQIFQDNPSETIFLDVRRPEEWQEGAIPGSLKIRLNNLAENFPKLDKVKQYIVICRSGFRSEIACQDMLAAGFNRVFNVPDGMLGWVEKGYPVEPHQS